MTASRPHPATRIPLAALVVALALLPAAPASARSAPRALRAGAPAAPVPRLVAASAVPDGAGGVYAAWVDARDGSSDVYALRLTASGAPAGGWPASGVAVCAAPGEQTEPVLSADPAGGVFVCWRDARDGAYTRSYRMQRLDAAGAAQWSTGGVPVAPGATAGPVAAPDGTGGVVFAWTASGTSGRDVFVGRLLANGTVPSGWSAAGVAVCEAAGDQHDPAILGLAGGLRVVWIDPRAGFASPGVYAQRVAADGTPQWAADGVRVDVAATFVLDVALCGDGGDGATVAWCDLAGAHAQHLDGAGAGTWDASGVALAAPASAVVTRIAVVSDGAAGAFVDWVESDAVSVLKAQHLDPSGTELWPAGGTALASGGGAAPSLADLVPDAAHGAYFAWDAPRADEGYDVYVQRVDFLGTPRWTAGGVALCVAPGLRTGAALAPDGAGGVVVTWSDLRDLADDVYGQRVDSLGVTAWEADGRALRADPGTQYAAATVADGAGGAWSVWQEKRTGGFDVYARHVTDQGSPDGPAVAVCTASGHQWFGGAVSDGAGGVVIAWSDERGADADVFAQRVTAAGAVAWAADGVPLCTATGDQYDVRLTPDGTGGCFAAWVDDRIPGDSDISVRRIDGAGVPQWAADGLPLIGDTDPQADPVIASDGVGGAIVAWFDARSGSTNEIYAQRVTAGGAVRWAAGGVAIASDIDLSLVAHAVPAGSDGAFVLFERSWSDPDTGEPTADVVALQWVDSTGTAHWGATGATVCDVAAIAEAPLLAADGAGGALVAWSDGRAGAFEPYAQRVDATGAMLWTADGVAVGAGAGAGWRQLGQLVPDGAGGALLAWGDWRGGATPDLYAQRLGATGTPQWAAGGVVVSTATAGQYAPALASDGAGGALVAWTDDRDAPVRWVYSAHVDVAGMVTPADGLVGVSASLVSAEAAPGAVRLVWQVADAAACAIERRDAASDWVALATRAVDGDGRVTFVDADAPAGARLAYRLRVAGANPFVTSEVWVDVPRAPAFALAGVRPNPVARAASVAFSLSEAGPATAELFDPSGRRVLGQRWPSLAAGAHVMPLAVDGLPPGLYVLRLAAGARAATTRVVMTR